MNRRLFLAMVLIGSGCGKPADPVSKWFHDNLDDPGSLEIVERIEVESCPDHTDCTIECVKFRSKNRLGAMQLQRRFFHHSQGKVLAVWSEDDAMKRFARIIERCGEILKIDKLTDENKKELNSLNAVSDRYAELLRN